MFDIKDVKLIMDSVHGYIRIPKLFVEHIIDTKEFQRLRYIDQTGMKILYPSAKHDRFSHSLGVYYLGNIAVDALLNNFKENIHWKIRSNNSRYIYWAKNKILFLISCLLHDIAHAPFSHAFEQFYEFDQSHLKTKLISQMGITLCAESNEEIGYIGKAANHELMSAYLVLNDGSPWRERIRSILEGLKNMPFPEPIETLTGEYDNPFPSIDSSDLEEDLRFIARMILGVKYADYTPEKQIRNCFIELLNGSIDVDKLDYIVRDTKMSGISNITLDIERLLGSLTIIPTTIYKEYTFHESSPNYKDVIIRRLETFKSNEVIISGTPDRDFTVFEGDISIPIGTTISLKCVDNIANKFFHYEDAEFDKDSIVCINGKVLEPSVQHETISVNSNKKENINLELEHATVIKSRGTTNFNFSVIKENGVYKLRVLKASNPMIMNAEIDLQNSMFTGSIKGKVKYLEVLSDDLNNTQLSPTRNCYTGYSIGFNKQAINLISNVFDARNYLYLWIYSHHKVIYYANFLIIELARLAIPSVCNISLRDFLTNTIITPDSSFLLDEGNIHHLIREANIKKSCACPQFNKLFEELVSRKYCRSLYKSLAEYDIIFERYSSSEKMQIRKHLETISYIPFSNRTTVKDNITTVSALKYGYIKMVVLKKMHHDGIALSDVLEDLIWIDSKPSIKQVDPTQIIIAVKGQHMDISMDRFPILNTTSIPIEQKQYFYLYYHVKPKSSIKIEEKELQSIIKEALYTYLNNSLFHKEPSQ